MKTRPERDPQQTTQCTYSILCECGRSYIGETGRRLAMRPREHRHSLKEGLLDRSKLAQHAYEEGHRVGWDFGMESYRMQGISPYGMLNQSNQPTQFVHFSNLDPPYQQ
jgi:hypothetical protein